MKRVLQFKDVEQLENTSLATIALQAGLPATGGMLPGTTVSGECPTVVQTTYDYWTIVKDIVERFVYSICCAGTVCSVGSSCTTGGSVEILPLLE